jgi:hypothetical protein
MSDAHKNFPYSTVATAPSPATSGTSLVLAAGGGVLMPAVPFNATVWPVSAQPLASNAEIVRVTDVTTDTLTIVRQQESTSARTIVAGDQFAATITQKSWNDNEGKRVIAEDTIVKSGYGQSAIGDLEISSGVVLEIESDGVIEIA